MAQSPVMLLLEKLESFILDEAKLLGGVHGNFKKIESELDAMVAFLQDADRREEEGDHEHGVKAWVKQVREVAYDIEDVVDEYSFHLDRRRPLGCNTEVLCKVLHLVTRHRIASQLKKIMSNVEDIKVRKDRYAFNDEHPRPGNTRLEPRAASLFIDEFAFVGPNAPTENLLKWLTSGPKCRAVLSVVGMGGMGKTTLVRKLCSYDTVKKEFKCFAWFTVSMTYSMSEILQSLIKDTFKQTNKAIPSDLEEMKNTKLMELLKSHLKKKKYAIVLDDVWDSKVWEEMQHVLPNETSLGRLIITTRNRDVASRACGGGSGRLHELQPLRPNEAFDLFCRKAFPLERRCPTKLEELSKDIIKKCGGLPLAIVTIGGLLAGKGKNVIEWHKVHRGLGSQNEHHLDEMKKILFLSYYDLPYNLKSCFLYLSLFPQSYTIKCTKLVRLWIAEGFVKGEENMTMEEVANGYLNDLINRSVIQVVDISNYEKVISCCVHDLVREIILSKAKEENFITYVREDCKDLNTRPRRLSIHESFDVVPQRNGLTQLRSLFTFGVTKGFSMSSVRRFFSECRLLKVLDLDGLPIQMFPAEVTDLLHLRYLSFRNTEISVLPKSVGKLRNIETLDLKGTKVRKLPKEVLNLRKLRNLLVYSYESHVYVTFDTVKGVKMPLEIGNLVALQKLSWLDLDGKPGLVRELKKLTKLKTLRVMKITKDDGKDLCDALQEMKGLLSFSVGSMDEGELLDVHSLSNPPMMLQRLYLNGLLNNIPGWIPNLQYLNKLRLRWSKLEADPFESLQGLPNLEELVLLQAYGGKELCCGGGGFKKLKVLVIDQLNELEIVKIGKETMVCLQTMSIKRCPRLVEVPLGIERIPHLKELNLFDMPNQFEDKVRNSKGVKNIQVIYKYYWCDGQWCNEILYEHSGITVFDRLRKLKIKFNWL